MSAKKILVIGAGPGGNPAAFKARELGADVIVVEKAEAGGVCLNWGCIPSKSYLDAAHRFHVVKHLGSLLKDGSDNAIETLMQSISWGKIQTRRQNVITKLKGFLRKTFDAKGIKYIQGTAAFVSPNEVEITTATGKVKETFDAAIIAAGTESFLPPPLQPYKEHILDNKTIFNLDKLPKSVAIIGGGVIGVEFSCFFNALGCEVSIIEMMPNLLPGDDDAICRTLQSSFMKRDIKLHLGKTASSIKTDGSGKTVMLSDGQEIKCDIILGCVGRTAKLEELAVEKAGLSWDRKGIKADKQLRTSVPHIFAVGDVNGMDLLAHAASAQGEIAAENAMGASIEYNNDLIPKCIYTWPEVASVGMNKKQAESSGIETKVQRTFFAASGRAMTQDDTDGFVQIVSRADNGQLLGAQMAGLMSTEMIHIFSVAIHAKLSGKDLKHVIFAHPTMSETIHEALAR